MRPYQAFRVVHGLGYSRFYQRIDDIESELTVLVAPADPVQVFPLTLTNAGLDALT